MRTSFWYFIIVETCIEFSIIRFYFSFKIFFVVFRITIKLFTDSVFKLFNNWSFFIKKDLSLILSKFFLYALILAGNVHKDLYFSIFIADEIFKSFFTKIDLITTILLKSIFFFIEIGLLCWRNVCFSVSILPSVIIVFSIFIYAYKNFYGGMQTRFLMESVVRIRFMALFLLIKLITQR